MDNSLPALERQTAKTVPPILFCSATDNTPHKPWVYSLTRSSWNCVRFVTISFVKKYKPQTRDRPPSFAGAPNPKSSSLVRGAPNRSEKIQGKTNPPASPGRRGASSGGGGGFLGQALRLFLSFKASPRNAMGDEDSGEFLMCFRASEKGPVSGEGAGVLDNFARLCRAATESEEGSAESIVARYVARRSIYGASEEAPFLDTLHLESNSHYRATKSLIAKSAPFSGFRPRSNSRSRSTTRVCTSFR